MLATCMKYKTIKNFLLNYNESRWSKLIPSLLEIAILNLHISFKTNFFSEKDLENIIFDLKSNFTKKLRKKELTMKADLDQIIIQKSKNSKKILRRIHIMNTKTPVNIITQLHQMKNFYYIKQSTKVIMRLVTTKI